MHFLLGRYHKEKHEYQEAQKYYDLAVKHFHCIDHYRGVHVVLKELCYLDKEVKMRGEENNSTYIEEEELIGLIVDFDNLFKQMAQTTEHGKLKDMSTVDRRQLFQNDHHMMAVNLEIAMEMGEKTSIAG